MRIRSALTTMVAAAAVMVGVPLTMLATAPPAFACSCVPSDIAAQVAGHDVVFAGTVTTEGERQGDGPFRSSADLVEWQFQVDAVHKGTVAPDQPVFTAESSASCGYEFVVGRTYLVIGSSVDGTVTTGLCDGTAELTDVPVADLERLGPGAVPAVAEQPAADSAEKAEQADSTPAVMQPEPGDRTGVIVAVLIAAGLVVVGGVALGTVLVRRRSRSS